MLVSLRNAAAHHVSTATKPLGFFARIKRARSLHQERQALLRMDDALLRDIGLTREQALDEAARPIWDAPSTWRR
ncbi:MAG: DUF1127 domain-containing protein [Paracoccaceae bacterium]